MGPKYGIGQKVRVKRSKGEASSARDSDIVQYDGQSGTVTNYYWISPTISQVFYIYTVKLGRDQKEIVMHEDEIKADKARVH